MHRLSRITVPANPRTIHFGLRWVRCCGLPREAARWCRSVTCRALGDGLDLEPLTSATYDLSDAAAALERAAAGGGGNVMLRIGDA